MITHTRPQWKHDCSICQFVGIYGTSDVYLCVKENITEVVIRNSNEGAIYWSGAIFKPKE